MEDKGERMEDRTERKGRGTAGNTGGNQTHKTRTVLGWEDGSVSKVLALSTRGPEFNPQEALAGRENPEGLLVSGPTYLASSRPM